ncbi:hypothetical protein N7495_009282 [Penicillium taxi]|uniref:uncharacterized protein n=1 Tax=Penicillium taxi TaxID=168475 RepID=UPI0025457270|nr:uncharacterized protein N7495_009282 [Penicillium taxi]KAJ5884772.1 hypothetical protein N7495_009282 [Penicillium taxi]
MAQRDQFALLMLFVGELASSLNAQSGLERVVILVCLMPFSKRGFGGSTYLQDAILSKSAKRVRQLLPNLHELHKHRNFLGQTPLHLALVDPEVFLLILDTDHQLDVIDNWGITPLMYASAMGDTNAVDLLIKKGANILTCDTHWNRDFLKYAFSRGHWNVVCQALDTIQKSYGRQVFQHYVCNALLNTLYNDTISMVSRSSHFEYLVELCDDVNFEFRDDHERTDCNNLLHYVRDQKEFEALTRRGFRYLNKPNSEGKLANFSITSRVSNADLTRLCLENGTDVNHIDHDGRSIFFQIVPQLTQLAYTTWDTHDSIKLCLAWNLDVFISDCCKCACSTDGCNSTAAFDIQFKPSIFTNLPKFVWAFEWLSLVEEYRGHDAAKVILLSFLRRTLSDMLEITHTCCHRGKGIKSKFSIMCQSKLTPEDVEEILDEEQEFIDILEKEMQGYNSKSLSVLRSEWMVLLKQSYDESLKKLEKERRGYKNQRSRLEIDYKNDKYYDVIYVGHDFSFNLARSMAEYAFWLQHECSRTAMHQGKLPVRDGWYEKRISWFVEMIDIMKVPAQEIEKEIKKINLAESRSEIIDREEIIQRFRTFIDPDSIGIHS